MKVSHRISAIALGEVSGCPKLAGTFTNILMLVNPFKGQRSEHLLQSSERATNDRQRTRNKVNGVGFSRVIL